MQSLSTYLIVFLGAGIGGMMRHGVNVASFRLIGPDLPIGTLVINVVGSLFIGAIAGQFAMKGHADHHLSLFLTTGVLGGFTTFSAFSLEAALLWERGQLLGAAAYVGGSVVLSVAGVFAGLAMLRS